MTTLKVLFILLLLTESTYAHHGGYHKNPCYTKSSKCTARKYVGNM